MSGLQRAFADDLIKTYFDMGAAALERGEFAIAQKMFKAVFEEPSAKTQKEKIMLSLLIKSAQAHEGLRQFYKAKLIHTRSRTFPETKSKSQYGDRRNFTGPGSYKRCSGALSTVARIR